MNDGTKNGRLWRLTAVYVSLDLGVSVLLGNIDFEPGDIFSACFTASAKREIVFCERFGKLCLYIKRYLQEIYQLQNLLSIPYQYLLAKYLRLALYLNVLSSHRMFARLFAILTFHLTIFL